MAPPTESTRYYLILEGNIHMYNYYICYYHKIIHTFLKFKLLYLDAYVYKQKADVTIT